MWTHTFGSSADRRSREAGLCPGWAVCQWIAEGAWAPGKKAVPGGTRPAWQGRSSLGSHPRSRSVRTGSGSWSAERDMPPHWWWIPSWGSGSHSPYTPLLSPSPFLLFSPSLSLGPWVQQSFHGLHALSRPSSLHLCMLVWDVCEWERHTYYSQLLPFKTMGVSHVSVTVEIWDLKKKT